MKILRYLPLLVLALVTTAAAEDDPQAVSQTDVRREVEGILASPAIELADLFRMAELTNPDLAVARIEVQARTGRMRQAGLYPNPELSFEVEEMSVDDPSFHKQKLALSQAILIGGRRGAAVNAARTEVEQAAELALGERRNVIGRVHKFWADQIYFREVEAAFEKLMAEAEGNLDIARARYEAKAAPESHMTRAMLEVYDLEVSRQDFERNRVVSAAEMKVLFGGVEVPLDKLSGSLDQGAEAISLPPETPNQEWEHPTLRAARLGVEVAEAMQETAKKERIPDLNLFVAYGRAHAIEENYVEGGISFPLPIFNRNQGEICRAEAEWVAAQRRLRRVELELLWAASGVCRDT
jgi:cobalt-zinc-cadmium efflux system outer membrane protein